MFTASFLLPGFFPSLVHLRIDCLYWYIPWMLCLLRSGYKVRCLPNCISILDLHSGGYSLDSRAAEGSMVPRSIWLPHLGKESWEWTEESFFNEISRHFLFSLPTKQGHPTKVSKWILSAIIDQHSKILSMYDTSKVNNISQSHEHTHLYRSYRYYCNFYCTYSCASFSFILYHFPQSTDHHVLLCCFPGLP